MEIESRPRRTSTTTTTSELFVCFTSRLSHSSSMRLSSKSILSPGHSSADKSAASLSSSLSRRLRHNGSLRKSPAMFPSKKTRGGSGFDNPEPSSPKVTCIGQVRVKTKKQGKKMKMRACRSSKRLSSGGGEASFRRIEGLMRQNSSQQQQECMLNQRNQRWVHLPLTICEALRAFGAEFSCLLPCKSSCFSSCGGGGERDKGGKDSGESCGGVFRWLVAFQEGEGRERDIELVVEEEVEEVERVDCSSRRRSIFDDMEFKDEIFHAQNELTERGRVSVCVPPKNALLLMRCRSDPAKMSALSHKIWEPPLPHHSDEDEAYEVEADEVEAYEVEVEAEKENVEEEEEIDAKMGEKMEEIEKLCGDCVVIDANVEGYEMGTEELAISTEEEEKQDEEEEEEETQGIENRDKTEKIAAAVLLTGKVEENEPYRCSIDAITIRKMFEEKTDPDITNNETKTVEMGDLCSSSSSCSSVQESTAETQQDEENVKSMEEAKERDEEEEELRRPDPIPSETLKEVKKKVLPDCLLLMMCEPKLSMEVSKETWVCSTDFIRWLPERPHTKKPTKIDASNEPKRKKKPPPPIQPGRSSISFPTGGVEQKLLKTGVGYEPLVLPRCKSAPLRSTAKIAPPEMACSMWRRENGRKMEPHRPATYGVGAAGVGF